MCGFSVESIYRYFLRGNSTLMLFFFLFLYIASGILVWYIDSRPWKTLFMHMIGKIRSRCEYITLSVYYMYMNNGLNWLGNVAYNIIPLPVQMII